jgi:hypothetical protein
MTLGTMKKLSSDKGALTTIRSGYPPSLTLSSRNRSFIDLVELFDEPKDRIEFAFIGCHFFLGNPNTGQPANSSYGIGIDRHGRLQGLGIQQKVEQLLAMASAGWQQGFWIRSPPQDVARHPDDAGLQLRIVPEHKSTYDQSRKQDEAKHLPDQRKDQPDDHEADKAEADEHVIVSGNGTSPDRLSFD